MRLPLLSFPASLLLCAGLVALAGSTAPAAQLRGVPLRPIALRCEHLTDPVGIDAAAPRLRWQLESSVRGQHQTAFRVVVASSPALLLQEKPDLWDTGKVKGSETSVVYAGKPLASRTRCYWRVRAWDKDGKPRDWSDAATWSMGLLEPGDWRAQWISFKDDAPLHTSRQELYLPAPRLYRKPFHTAKPVRRATVYASALGLYELHLNGKRVGDALFTPGWTDYRRRVYYQTYDVTELVRKGENAIGAAVAEGWYSGYVGYGLLVGYGPGRVGRYFYGKTPALLAQLEVEYADGSREVIGTGPDWKVTDKHPIREADMLMGERYDARLEMPDWSRAAFDDTRWAMAIPAAANGSLKAKYFDAAGEREVELGFIRPARLEAYPGVPVRATQELRPVRVTEPEPGVFIFDLGQNFSGVARLNVTGPAGTEVRLRFGEMLHPDGRLMTENLRKARATDTYILRGDPRGETWTPQFTYHGFQFVEVTGYPVPPGQKPGLDAITGVVLHSDTPLTSAFECSDPMANRLFQNVVWTQRANFFEVPTDCPQRDERLGWMGDAQIYVRAATYHADVSAFFNKWLREVEESQLPNGAYPDYAPYPMFHGKPDGYGTAWTDAGVICPYTIFQVYGDTRVLSRHWDSMRRFMEFRKQRSPELKGVKAGNEWGDWLSLGETTPIEYVDAAYFAHSADLMARMAAALQKETEAADYRSLFERIRARFQADYLKADGALSVDTQTAYALALTFDLAPEALRQKLADRLAEKIRQNGNRMATGFLGTRPLLPVLSAHGHHDLAVLLFQSRQFPSWGYEVENGATSIWERWNSFTKESGFGNAAMNSFSHYSFGAVSEWMFASLAGIDTDGPGFRKIVLRPGPPTPGSNPYQTPVDWVRAKYHSPQGPISAEWKRTGTRFELNATVPVNTTATLYLPAKDASGILEGEKPLAKAPGVRFLRMEGDRAVIALGSGRYQFISEVAKP